MTPHVALRTLFEFALAAIDPRSATAEAVTRLTTVPPWDGRPLRVVALGKAAPVMVRGVVDICGTDGTYGTYGTGICAGPDEFCIGNVKLFIGDHPIPGSKTESATRSLLEWLRTQAPGPTLVLLSGGTSALLEGPDPATVRLLAEVTPLLLRSGMDIHEMNLVRRHLSGLKGGGLLRYFPEGPVHTLLISDVPGDDPLSIGSGPTIPSAWEPEEALRLIEAYGLRDTVSATAITQLSRQMAPTEGPISPSHPSAIRATWEVIASNWTARSAAAKAASTLGWDVLVIGNDLVLPAGDLAVELVSRIRQLGQTPLMKPFLIVAGGEPTVRVQGSGRGGRCRHLALEILLAAEADGLDVLRPDGSPRFHLLCGATDGSDGSGDVAGVLTDSTALIRARGAGLDPRRIRDDFDSGSLWSTLGEELVTGPTGTNVADIFLILAL